MTILCTLKYIVRVLNRLLITESFSLAKQCLLNTHTAHGTKLNLKSLKMCEHRICSNESVCDENVSLDINHEYTRFSIDGG